VTPLHTGRWRSRRTTTMNRLFQQYSMSCLPTPPPHTHHNRTADMGRPRRLLPATITLRASAYHTMLGGAVFLACLLLRTSPLARSRAYSGGDNVPNIAGCIVLNAYRLAIPDAGRWHWTVNRAHIMPGTDMPAYDAIITAGMQLHTWIASRAAV